MKNVNKKSIKILIVSDHKEKALVLIDKYREYFKVVGKDPDIIISYGGDGMFFRSEFLYPNVPKLYLKYSRIGKLSINKDNDTILKHIIDGEYKIENKTKLDVIFKKEKLVAVADVLVHNKNPRTAIRCQTHIDETPLKEEDIIGDGLLVATSLGSTGYYKSITRSYFEDDDQIGLAFNNSIEQINHIVLDKNKVIKVKIIRGIAQIFADNQDKFFEADNGDIIEIRVSKETMKVISFN